MQPTKRVDRLNGCRAHCRSRWSRSRVRRARSAQGSAVDEIAKYRAALQDGNPAELWEARGEALWKRRAARSTCRSSAATSDSGPASSRAPTRSCRNTSPTPTA